MYTFFKYLSGFKCGALGFAGTARFAVGNGYARRFTMPFLVIYAIDGVADNRERMIGTFIADVIGSAAGDGTERIAMGIIAAFGCHTANVNFVSAAAMLRVAAAMNNIARQMIFHNKTPRYNFWGQFYYAQL